MEWRAIPDFPGYEVSRRGVIRKSSSGYVYGTTANLMVNGKRQWANGRNLARIAFGDMPADLTPVPSPFVAVSSASTGTPASAPAPDIAPAAPAPVRDPEKDVLRNERDDALNRLELARRVNAHQMALIERLRSIINDLEAASKQRRERDRKGKKRAVEPDNMPLSGAVDTLAFEEHF
jgi:hypothetical protein